MSGADYLALGDWNAACAWCGRKRKASTMRQLPPGVPGGGLRVCPDHWNPRQPQDFVRGIPDYQAPPWVQPEADNFVQICTPNTITAIAWYAEAGCAIAGYVSPMFDPSISEE